MSEAEQQTITAADVGSAAAVLAPLFTPEATPDTATPPVPQGTDPAPANERTVQEAKVAALEAKVAELEKGLQTLEDAWLHFAESGTKAIEEIRRSSGAEGHADLDRRLKVIEASRF